MDNPSATPTVRHLPLHRGGVNSEKAELSSSEAIATEGLFTIALQGC